MRRFEQQTRQLCTALRSCKPAAGVHTHTLFESVLVTSKQQGSTRYIPTAHGSKPWCPRCCPQLVRAAVLSSLAMKSSAQSAAVRPRAQDFRPQSGVPKKLPDTLFGGDASKGIDLQIFGPTLRKNRKISFGGIPTDSRNVYFYKSF